MSKPTPILLKINVSKIEKQRLFKGEKGTYLDAALVPVENDQYGNDFMIVQSVSKEEREKGVKGAIIGNAKYMKSKAQDAPKAEAPKASEPESDDIPF